MQLHLSQLVSLVALSSWGVMGALASPVGSPRALEKRVSNSKWSFYDAGLGACGVTNSNSDFIVALSAADFGSGYPGPHCGKTITMRYNGKTATAKIMDRCPGCPKGGLDLSRGLFKYFASEDKGIIYGDWEFGSGGGNPAPAPTPSTTSTRAAPVTPTSTPQATTSSPAPLPSSSFSPAPRPSSPPAALSRSPVSNVVVPSSSAAPSSVTPSSTPSAPASSSAPAPAPAAPSPSSAPVQDDDDEEYDEDCEEWEEEEEEETPAASSAVPAPSPSNVAPVQRPAPPPAPPAAPTGAKDVSPAPSATTAPTKPAENFVKDKPVANVAPIPSTSASPGSGSGSVEQDIQESMNMISQLFSKLTEMIKTLVEKSKKDA